MSAPSNRDRAWWADEALKAFADITRCDQEDALADLLCDLMHWADLSEFAFERELDRARQHYAAEVAEERVV